MNPDLKKYNAKNLEIQGEFDIPSDIAIKLRDYSKPDKDGDSLFITKHPRHQVWMWMITLSKMAKDGSERYQMRYYCKPGRAIKSKGPSIEGLVDLLSPAIDKIDLHISVDFLFKKDLKAEPIIEMPNRYISYTDAPFDYIQGYHFTKKDTELGKGYNVVVDSFIKGEYFVRVMFERSEIFDNEVFDNCIKGAESIARKFVHLGK